MQSAACAMRPVEHRNSVKPMRSQLTKQAGICTDCEELNNTETRTPVTRHPDNAMTRSNSEQHHADGNGDHESVELHVAALSLASSNGSVTAATTSGSNSNCSNVGVDGAVMSTPDNVTCSGNNSGNGASVCSGSATSQHCAADGMVRQSSVESTGSSGGRGGASSRTESSVGSGRAGHAPTRTLCTSASVNGFVANGDEGGTHQSKGVGGSHGSDGASLARSLSLDSGRESLYTDDPGKPLDSFFIQKLNGSADDRNQLLNIERMLTNYMLRGNDDPLPYNDGNGYTRLLTHKVCAFFGLSHPVDRTSGAIMIGRTDYSRIPPCRFVELIECAPGSATCDDEPIKLLKRDVNSTEDQSPKKSTGHKKKSYEEREREYNEAKSRIFNLASEGEEGCETPLAPDNVTKVIRIASRRATSLPNDAAVDGKLVTPGGQAGIAAPDNAAAAGSSGNGTETVQVNVGNSVMSTAALMSHHTPLNPLAGSFAMDLSALRSDAAVPLQQSVSLQSTTGNGPKADGTQPGRSSSGQGSAVSNPSAATAADSSATQKSQVSTTDARNAAASGTPNQSTSDAGGQRRSASNPTSYSGGGPRQTNTYSGRRSNVGDPQALGYRCPSPYAAAKLQQEFVCPSPQLQQQVQSMVPGGAVSFITLASPGAVEMIPGGRWIGQSAGIGPGGNQGVQGYSISQSPFGTVYTPYPVQTSHQAGAYHPVQVPQYFHLAQEQPIYVATTQNPPISSPHPTPVPAGSVTVWGGAGGQPQSQPAMNQQFVMSMVNPLQQQQQLQYTPVASQQTQQQQQQQGQQQQMMGSPQCPPAAGSQQGYIVQSMPPPQSIQQQQCCYPPGQQAYVVGPSQFAGQQMAPQQFAGQQMVMNPMGAPCYIQQISPPAYAVPNMPPPMQAVPAAAAAPQQYYYTVAPGTNPVRGGSPAYTLQSAAMPLAPPSQQQQQQIRAMAAAQPSSVAGDGMQPMPAPSQQHYQPQQQPAGVYFVMQRPPPSVPGTGVSEQLVPSHRLPPPPSSVSQRSVGINAQPQSSGLLRTSLAAAANSQSQSSSNISSSGHVVPAAVVSSPHPAPPTGPPQHQGHGPLMINRPPHQVSHATPAGAVGHHLAPHQGQALPAMNFAMHPAAASGQMMPVIRQLNYPKQRNSVGRATNRPPVYGSNNNNSPAVRPAFQPRFHGQPNMAAFRPTGPPR